MASEMHGFKAKIRWFKSAWNTGLNLSVLCYLMFSMGANEHSRILAEKVTDATLKRAEQHMIILDSYSEPEASVWDVLN